MSGKRCPQTHASVYSRVPADTCICIVKMIWQERGALLADMFLDHGLWERRLHFAVFQSAHLEDYIKCGLVDVAREEAGS
jgi:hypothetical protein